MTVRRSTALLAVALLAGCGTTAHRAAVKRPTIPRALASSWRAQADGVAAALAAGDGCLAQQRAVALRTAVIAAVNARRLAPRFQEPLTGAVNDLASRITCVVPAAPAPPAPRPPGHKPEHGRGHGHGHGRGHDKGGDD